MKNDLFSIGPFTVHGYGLMIAIGIISAYLVSEYRAKRMKLNDELLLDLGIWGVVGGLLGAKLLYLITQFKEIIADPSVIMTTLTNGFVVYGGIIAGIFSGYLLCKKKKVKFLPYFDLIMPSVALAQAFGRIGCFLAGCCYGNETTSLCGIVFHNSMYAPNDIRLIPTQLISSGLDFINFIILLIFAKKNKVEGRVAGLYLVLYSAGRFVLEFFRGDLERGMVGTISTSQFISIILFLIGCMIVFLKKGPTQKETIQK